MLLEDKFFHLESMEQTDGRAVFHIMLLPDCDVYRGHFPGRPVCPGVCEMETVKELVAKATGHELTINKVKRCRFTAVATPASCPHLVVEARIAPSAQGYTVEATISDSTKQYMDFKGEMQVI